MSNSYNPYSVGQAILRVLERNYDLKEKLAEISVSVNSALSANSLRSIDNFRYTRVILKSNNHRDLFNLIVLANMIEDKQVKSLLLLHLQENHSVKNDVLLSQIAKEPAFLREYLVGYVNRFGFNKLFSILNFRTHKDNTKNILHVIKLKNESLGTERRRIPEKRRIGVGYRDKGHLPLNLKGHNPERFLDQRDLQNKIEINRKTREDTSDFIAGLLY